MPPGAEAAPFPGFVEFCHPEPRPHPPSGDRYLHEVKADGYRAQLSIAGGAIHIYSRRGYDWTGEFGSIARAAEFLRSRNLIIDGEAVVLNRAGAPDFNLLRRELGKAESAAYWRRVSKRALPYLAHRPLKLVRNVHHTVFYHKGPLPKDIPPAVHQLRIEKREGGEGVRLWVDSLEGLLGLVEIGAVELHPWNAIVEDVEHADQIVIDLDPGEGVEWGRVIDAALGMRDLMISDGLAPWPKLTGGKGIHLVAPLRRRMTHDRAHSYARRLASALAARDPERHNLSARAARTGRIFLDYLRNGRGTTAIGTYSPRVREEFPIAAPVTWARIEAGVHPDVLTIRSPFRARRMPSDRGARFGTPARFGN